MDKRKNVSNDAVIGNSGYEVTDQRGCKVVVGQVPLVDMAALLKEWSSSETLDDSTGANGWRVDCWLAEALGVALVVGPPEALIKWREEIFHD